MRPYRSAGLLLLVLAPAIGELLSGSMPPVEWLNPVGAAMVIVLYGGGAILVREAVLPWRKGWPTLLALGAAYGVLEEGLLCKSFFDPHWTDLGTLGVYGRWAGVNWVWAVLLTVYHAAVSIAVPITLVGLVFPEHCHRPWMGRAGLVALGVLVVADAAAGYFLLTKFRPPGPTYLVCAMVVLALVAVGRVLPAGVRPAPAEGGGGARPAWFFLTGLLGTVALFLGGWVMPAARAPVAATLPVLAAVPALVAAIVWRLSRGGQGWSDNRALALVAGALAFFTIVGPLSEMDPNRKDNPAGMWAVSLAALLLVVLLGRRVRRLSRNRQSSCAA